MNEQGVFLNPLHSVSASLSTETIRLDAQYKRSVPEPVSLQTGLLVMIDKAIDVTKILSKCMDNGAYERLDKAAVSVQGIHYQEKVLTAGLVSPNMSGQMLKGAIELPGSLERIGDMLECIANCYRVKSQNHITFSDRAHAELDQLFAFLLDRMINLRDALETPNQVLLDHIIFHGEEVSRALHSFRFAHWVRLKAGFCAPHASSIYLDLLDSMKTINEYLIRICVALQELGTASSILFRKVF
jgi:Na+/phosphate symporter